MWCEVAHRPGVSCISRCGTLQTNTGNALASCDKEDNRQDDREHHLRSPVVGNRDTPRETKAGVVSVSVRLPFTRLPCESDDAIFRNNSLELRLDVNTRDPANAMSVGHHHRAIKARGDAAGKIEAALCQVSIGVSSDTSQARRGTAGYAVCGHRVASKRVRVAEMVDVSHKVIVCVGDKEIAVAIRRY